MYKKIAMSASVAACLQDIIVKAAKWVIQPINAAEAMGQLLCLFLPVVQN